MGYKLRHKMALRQKRDDMIPEEDKILDVYKGINIYAKLDGKGTIYVHNMGEFTEMGKAKEAIDEWVLSGGLEK